jgi:hypothetical protein
MADSRRDSCSHRYGSLNRGRGGGDPWERGLQWDGSESDLLLVQSAYQGIPRAHAQPHNGLLFYSPDWMRGRREGGGKAGKRSRGWWR